MNEFRGSLRVLTANGERIVRLSDGALIVGRAPECDVVVADERVSRRHLRIDISATEIAVTDLGSRQGTLVDGIKVTHATLGEGSIVAIGDCRLRLEQFAETPSHPAPQEYIEVAVGSPEPTLVESLAPGEITVSHPGMQQVYHDNSMPRLVSFSHGGTIEYPLRKELTVLGRDPAADIVLTDPAASRRHCSLERRGDQVVLRDLDSKNGTWLRSQKVQEQALFNGANFRIGDTFLIYKAAFTHDSVSESDASLHDTMQRRPVVVLPGIMGSELYDSQGLLWPNLPRSLREPAKLEVGKSDSLTLGNIAAQIIVIPGFIKLDAYSELVKYLEEGLGYRTGRDLLQFPYDWRQDNRDSAEKLKEAIDDWRKRSIGDKKVTILCHSMGALVSRYYLECLGGKEYVDKFVTIGGAHFGAPFMVRGLLYGPDLLPLGIGRKGLHSALLSMPSVYQLVPPYPMAYDPAGKVIDLHADPSWASPKYRHLVKSAKDFHTEIGRTTSVPTTCIFGYGVKTVTRIQVDKRGPNGWEKVRFMMEHAGDNRVVDKFGYLEGADIHPVRQHHGSLWNDNDVKMRIRLELLNA